MHYTKQEQRILAILSDGEMHLIRDIAKTLDPLMDVRALRALVRLLKKKLRLEGQDIICQYQYRKYYYRHVRLLSHPDS